MEQRLLGKSGLMVPALSLGTGTFTNGAGSEFMRAWGSSGAKEASRMVDVCLEAGLNLFDTADIYSAGVSEEILGQAIAGRRNKVLISTKATFRHGQGPNDVGSSRQHLLEACEGSLKRLGTDHIDLYQMHGFDALTPVEETLKTLDQLVRAGKLRYIGCSNFSGWHLMKSLAASERLGLERYVAHQAYYNLVAREFEWELMPLGLDQGVGTVVWSPLAGGKLGGRIGRGRPAPADTRTSQLGDRWLPVDEEALYKVTDALEAVAAQAGRSVAQVALRWLLQRPGVATLVVGARDEAQLRQNLGAMEFSLSPEQVARLDAASARRPIYPYWHQRDSSLDRNPPPVL